ncbi:hypothetical protein HKD37_09G025663 [Glycine soja]
MRGVKEAKGTREARAVLGFQSEKDNLMPWNAFKDFASSVPMDALNQGLQMHDLPSIDDHFFYLRASEGSNKGGMQGIVPVARFDHDLSLHFVSGLPCPPSAFAPMCQLQFLDVSTLQAALPD